jgi:hypothetical protein
MILNFLTHLYKCVCVFIWEPRHRSRYSNSQRAGRLWDRSWSPCRVKNFRFLISSRKVLCPAQPSTQYVPEVLFLGVERHDRESDLLPRTIAEVKKMWIHSSTTTCIVFGLVQGELQRYTHTHAHAQARTHTHTHTGEWRRISSEWLTLRSDKVIHTHIESDIR